MDALSVYLDASVVVALFVNDSFQARADAAFRAHPEHLIVSDFTAAEFASSISRRVRTREMTVLEARDAFADFDAWKAGRPQQVESLPPDIRDAAIYMRRLDLPLRTPDAIHIAIAQRIDARLATFDARLAQCARTLGMPLFPL